MAWKVEFCCCFWLFSNHYHLLLILFLNPERDGVINYSFLCVWNGIKHCRIFPENIMFCLLNLNSFTPYPWDIKLYFPAIVSLSPLRGWSFSILTGPKLGHLSFNANTIPTGLNAPTAPFLVRFMDFGSPWEELFGCRAWPKYSGEVELCPAAPQGTENHQQLRFNELMLRSHFMAHDLANLSSSWLRTSRGAETPLLPWELDNSSTKFSNLWLLSGLKFIQNLHIEKLARFCCWVQWDPRMAWVARDMIINLSC